MQTKWFIQLPCLAFAVLFTMLVGHAGAHDNTLTGTWEVTLRFPEETCNRPECNCPGGTPDIPIPSLTTFLEHGVMLWSASTLAVGAGQGTWAFLGGDQFTARFKFFIFDLDTGRRVASEVLTREIRLTDPDTFEATTTYDLFDTAGNPTATGCIINETATRFE